MCFHKRAAPKAGCLSGKAPALAGFGPLSLINKMINPLEVEEFKVAPRRCPWGRGRGVPGGPAAPQNPPGSVWRDPGEILEIPRLLLGTL